MADTDANMMVSLCDKDIDIRYKYRYLYLYLYRLGRCRASSRCRCCPLLGTQCTRTLQTRCLFQFLFISILEGEPSLFSIHFFSFFIFKVAEVLATFLVRNKLASATEAFQPVGVVDRIPLGGFPMAPPLNNPTAGIGIKPAGLMPPPPPPV